MKVYLAGPMRGYAEFNFPAFIKAAAELRAVGYEIISPAEHELDDGYDPVVADPADDSVPQSSVMWDISQIIENAEGVVVLPGWEASRGARAEVSVAIFKNIPILVYVGNGHVAYVSHRQAERRAARAVL